MVCPWLERTSGLRRLMNPPCCLLRLWIHKIQTIPPIRPIARAVPTEIFSSSLNNPGDTVFPKCIPTRRYRPCSHGRPIRYPWDIQWLLKCAPWDLMEPIILRVRRVLRFKRQLQTRGTCSAVIVQTMLDYLDLSSFFHFPHRFAVLKEATFLSFTFPIT